MSMQPRQLWIGDGPLPAVPSPSWRCCMWRQHCRATHPWLQSDCLQEEGFHYEETLTGFKWLGNRALELQQQGFHVLFAFEEAIGFMLGTAVRDKVRAWPS